MDHATFDPDFRPMIIHNIMCILSGETQPKIYELLHFWARIRKVTPQMVSTPCNHSDVPEVVSAENFLAVIYSATLPIQIIEGIDRYRYSSMRWDIRLHSYEYININAGLRIDQVKAAADWAHYHQGLRPQSSCVVRLTQNVVKPTQCRKTDPRTHLLLPKDDQTPPDPWFR